MTVAMVPVKSQNLKAVGHDPATGDLHVLFHSGPKVYVHSNVSAEQHAALMSAESVGRHYGANIAGNPKHPHRKPESQQ